MSKYRALNTRSKLLWWNSRLISERFYGLELLLLKSGGSFQINVLHDLSFSRKSQTDLCGHSQRGSASYSCSYSYIHTWELHSMNTLCDCRPLSCSALLMGPNKKKWSRHGALAAQWMSNSSLVNTLLLLYHCCHFQCSYFIYCNSLQLLCSWFLWCVLSHLHLPLNYLRYSAECRSMKCALPLMFQHKSEPAF